MIMSIRMNSDIPIYKQLVRQIVNGIADGSLSPGEQLPTVRALAEEIGVNVMTVNKAYQSLKKDGYIEADRRNGARVKTKIVQKGEISSDTLEALQNIIMEAKVKGVTEDAFIQKCREFYNLGKENMQ